MKDNITNEIDLRYDKYNKRPFNVDPLLEDNVKIERLRLEYVLKILLLNEYLTEFTEFSIKENQFSDFTFDWINDKKKREFKPFDYYIIKTELLFFCGTFAFSEIMWNEVAAEGKRMIIEYEKKEKFEEKQIEKIEAILDEFETKIAHLHIDELEDELFDLHKKYFKLVINNNGRSILTYVFGRRFVEETKDRTGISKSKIVELIAEVFEMFEFISKRAKINFIDNFYRDLNRINPQKEESLIRIAERISRLFAS